MSSSALPAFLPWAGHQPDQISNLLAPLWAFSDAKTRVPHLVTEHTPLAMCRKLH